MCVCAKNILSAKNFQFHFSKFSKRERARETERGRMGATLNESKIIFVFFCFVFVFSEIFKHLLCC